MSLDAQMLKMRKAARMWLGGISVAEISRMLGHARATIDGWLCDPAILAYMEELERPVEDRLLDLERKALDVKEKVLDSGLDPEASTETLKLADAAATDLLNRRGERGKPIERGETKNLSVNGADLQNLLSSLSRDPGTRKILEANPKVKTQLLLPSAPDRPAESGTSSEAPISSSF